MKFNFQHWFQKAKSSTVKHTNYRVKVEVSFLANFLVHYERPISIPVIREFYATEWNTELNFPEGYNVWFKVFVRNPSGLKGASVTLSIENMNEGGGIVFKKFEINNSTAADSEWFRLSLW